VAELLAAQLGGIGKTYSPDINSPSPRHGIPMARPASLSLVGEDEGTQVIGLKIALMVALIGMLLLAVRRTAARG
jgi:hypothetical protein